MNKEQKEIRKAELIATLNDARDILNELLAYSREGLSVSTIVEYASLFTILNDGEYYKDCDVSQTWEEYTNVPTEDDIKEYCSYTDYDIFFDNITAWEKYEDREKRNKQIQEIAIQAALEGVAYETCESFIQEYELTTEEISVFDYIYNNTIRAAEGRYRRHRRTDPNYYLAYKIRRDKELNDWCKDNEIVTPYNPNTVCHAHADEEEDKSVVKPCDSNKEVDDYDWGIWDNEDLPF